jgi:HAD superfamily hydrolase (TIGR01509 family)
VIRALIWDAGGTLFDTYPALVKACQSVLKLHGIEADDTWLMQLFRQTTSHAISRLAETFDLDDESLERDLREAYAQMPPEIQPPFPGVVAVCRYMLKTGGANFIVTHRDWQSLRPLLDHYEMRDLFVHWITADDAYPRKPNPASIRAVIDQYGLTADACLVIGDREIDTIAARRAGTLSCFFTRREVRLTISADLIIEDFFELLTWLQTEYQDTHNKTIPA